VTSLPADLPVAGAPGAHDPERAAVKVLFIMGWDRSGSTILDLLLGAIHGSTAVGELSNIWKRGIVEGRSCGCGRPVLECDVWSAVLRDVFGRVPTPEDARAIMAFRRRHTRMRHTWRILRGGDPGLRRYGELLSRMHHAIAARTGARVVVDSSKDASDAAALLAAPGVDVSFVHLVRDPRAVAYSLRHRPKVQTDAAEPSRMRRLGVFQGTLDWVIWNVAAERVARAARGRTFFLRYEDLVEDPRGALRSIAELVGEADAELPFVDERSVIVEPAHTVSGNPSRFSSGRVDIRGDDEWRREQPVFDRWTATAIAAPLMRRYGYALRCVTGRVGSAADRTPTRTG
jgi:hypothetical protein